MKKIVVDILGADADARVLADGAISALEGQNEYDLIMVGPAEVITEAAAACGDHIAERIEIVNVKDAFSNHDNPSKMALGDNSTSMARALSILKEREDAAGLVSAGSTGALMVGSIFRLGLFKGLMQPALSCALYNTKGGYFCMADCGANINVKEKDLIDYARMGSAFMSAMNGVENPAVGLLNVGREENKGTELLKSVWKKLDEDRSINFIGNIEGSDVLSGIADVVVCDGFTGNVLLKSLEACGLTAAKMAGNPENVVKFFSYNDQGGATFLGTKKIIVKAHGAANELTMKACIEQVWKMECGCFTEKMAAAMDV